MNYLKDKFIATVGPRNYQHIGYEFCLLDYPFELFDFLPCTEQVFSLFPVL
jgi:hypothetical protein